MLRHCGNRNPNFKFFSSLKYLWHPFAAKVVTRLKPNCSAIHSSPFHIFHPTYTLMNPSSASRPLIHSSLSILSSNVHRFHSRSHQYNQTLPLNGVERELTPHAQTSDEKLATNRLGRAHWLHGEKCWAHFYYHFYCTHYIHHIRLLLYSTTIQFQLNQIKIQS